MMPPSEEIKKKTGKFPVLQGILPVKRSQVPFDIIAGITLAALAIPEVMGYAKIAGMPVVTGLYTILIPLAVFAFFGSSRHLVVGADSATAAILATALVTMALPGSPQYVALAGHGRAACCRIFNPFAYLQTRIHCRFPLSLGAHRVPDRRRSPDCPEPDPRHARVPGAVFNPIPQLVTTFTSEVPRMNGVTILLSAVVLVIIMAGGRFMKKIPWPCFVVIGTIIVSWALNLTSLGVTMIGQVPIGLPAIAFPAVSPGQIPCLLGVSAACFVVILAQSAATSRAYAARYEEKFDENVDLVGLGLSNVAAGISGTFVVNGSPTKTEMVDSAGGRTQIAQVVTLGVVIVVLLFLAGPFSYLPGAVLATIVFTIGVHLIDVNGMNSLFFRRPVEFMVALITALTVVFTSVGWGIALAIVLSTIAHLRHSYRPLNFLLVESPRGWTLHPVESGKQAAPGLAVYQFGANLYYANEARFTSEILDIADTARPPLRWLCVSASSIQDIDFSGSEALKQLHGELRKRGVVLVMSAVEEPVMRQLDRDKLVDLIGMEHIFEFTKDVMVAYQKLPGMP